jgi:hypothetical protein
MFTNISSIIRGSLHVFVPAFTIYMSLASFTFISSKTESHELLTLPFFKLRGAQFSSASVDLLHAQPHHQCLPQKLPCTHIDTSCQDSVLNFRMFVIFFLTNLENQPNFRYFTTSNAFQTH